MEIIKYEGVHILVPSSIKYEGITMSNNNYDVGSELDDQLEKFKVELYGIEYEEEEEYEEEPGEVPFDADKIRIEQRMLSLKYIIELLEEDKLELSPGFQRNKVWKENKRKSLLIESLMLRIPIPAFYFYEDENSNYFVIDGLQRLSTISEFINGKFRLYGLQYLQEPCGRKAFKELDSKYVNRIYQTQLAVNIIDARTPPQVKYDLFRRINTGGVSLNAQEIRNSIAHNRTRAFLKKLSTSETFLQATGGVNDQRMAAQELVLRFVAFYEAYNPHNRYIEYEAGNLESFLDKSFEELNRATDEKLHQYDKSFIKGLQNARILFGEFAFRKVTDADILLNNRKLLNKSLFTSWTVLLSHLELSTELLHKKSNVFLQAFLNRIERDEEYSASLTMGTNSTRQVRYSFNVAQTLIDEVFIDD